MNDSDRNFEIDLAQIGMRYGAIFALGVAIFAIGGTLMLTTSKEFIPYQVFLGDVFLLIGFIISIWVNFWKAEQIFKLKKCHMTETENLQNRHFSYKDFLISSLRCKRYNGTERKSKK